MPKTNTIYHGRQVPVHPVERFDQSFTLILVMISMASSYFLTWKRSKKVMMSRRRKKVEVVSCVNKNAKLFLRTDQNRQNFNYGRGLIYAARVIIKFP